MDLFIPLSFRLKLLRLRIKSTMRWFCDICTSLMFLKLGSSGNFRFLIGFNPHSGFLGEGFRDFSVRYFVIAVERDLLGHGLNPWDTYRNLTSFWASLSLKDSKEFISETSWFLTESGLDNFWYVSPIFRVEICQKLLNLCETSNRLT